MKSKINSLTQIFLKSSFQNMKTKNFSSKKHTSKSMIILYIISFGYLGAIIGFFSYQMISTLIPIHQEQLFIGIILMGIITFITFQTIFTSVSLFYYSKDNEYILPLPIKPWEIIASKTNVLIITEYMIEIIIGIIPLSVYGILVGANFVYYITMIIVLAILPILPIILSSLVVMIIMSFSKFTHNKNKFQLIATLISIIVIAGISFSSGNVGNPSEEQILEMMNQANGFVQTIKGYLPTLDPAINVLASSSIFQTITELVKLIGITSISYIIYILIAQKIYLKGAVGNLSSGNKTKGKINEKKAFKKSSLPKTYIGKEFKTLIRNPIFLMQCILPAILFPIIFIGATFFSLQGEDAMQMNEIFNSVPDKTTAMNGMAILAVLQFLSMFIYISITAVSRDGQNATFMKYIPVPLIKQIEYKIAPNIIMNGIMNIISLGLIQYIMKMPITYFILLFISSMIIATLQSYVMIIIDLKKPKLDWNSEYAVVKQNMNLMWPVIMGIIDITILLILGATFSAININGYIAIGIITLIYLVISLQTRKYIQNNQEKLLEKIF